MLTFWGVVTALTLGGGLPTVGGLWMFERRRSRRRNRGGECAGCGTGWSAVQTSEPYLIHGRLVCEGCADTARRRMPLHFGILGLATAVASGFILASASPVTMILLPLGSTVVLTLSSVHLMKLANRSAERLIATGEFPDIKALGPGLATSQD